MAAYHKVEVSLNTNAVEVGIPSAQTVNVVVPTIGPAGPTGAQGPAGTGIETLTAQGDLLYRGASVAARLPIGTSGQVLKVANGIPAWGNESGAVTSVNGETGAVSLSAADVGAAETLHATEHQDGEADQIMASAAVVSTDQVLLNGTYVPDGTLVSGRLVYYRPGTRKNTMLQYNPDTLRWNLVRNLVIEAENSEDGDVQPWQASWGDLPGGLLISEITVAQASLEKLARSTTENLGTAALTDSTSFAASSHIHGNLTNAGAIGTTANLPLKTGTNGVVEAGSFGTAAGSFAAGDDVRFSDARTPTAHKASHATGGTDALAPSDLGLGASDNVTFGGVTTPSLEVSGSIDATGAGLLNFQFTTEVGVAETSNFNTGKFRAEPDSLTANRTYDLPDASGTLALQGAISTSGLIQSTARILGRTTASTGAVEEIQIGSGLSLSAGQLSATGSGVTAVGTTLADILSVSGSDLVADDLAADKLYGWDDSESKAIGFIIGSGLSVSGDTLSATASGGSKTYAVFTAEHNQPTATAFATLDTRNSIAVLDFDDATDESAVFVSIIPEAASLGSGLKIRLHWMATTATSGNVVWDVSLERMTTDLDSDSFDTIASGTAAANGTSGILTVAEITLTTIDSVTAGDGYRLKVTRDANNASDTMTGDAELVAVEIRSAA